VAVNLRPPAALKPHLLSLGDLSPRALEGIEARLLTVPGVEAAAVAPEEGVAHLKVDSGRVDWARLSRIAMEDEPASA
jgi:hypothetical protein